VLWLRCRRSHWASVPFIQRAVRRFVSFLEITDLLHVAATQLRVDGLGHERWLEWLESTLRSVLRHHFSVTIGCGLWDGSHFYGNRFFVKIDVSLLHRLITICNVFVARVWVSWFVEVWQISVTGAPPFLRILGSIDDIFEMGWKTSIIVFALNYLLYFSFFDHFHVPTNFRFNSTVLLVI